MRQIFYNQIWLEKHKATVYNGPRMTENAMAKQLKQERTLFTYDPPAPWITNILDKFEQTVTTAPTNWQNNDRRSFFLYFLLDPR